MFTNESINIINNFVKNQLFTDIPEYLKLYNYLNNFNILQKRKILANPKNSKMLFMQNDFISKQLLNKVMEFNKNKTVEWITTGKYPIHCNLTVFYKNTVLDETLDLLVNAISFIMSFANKKKKLNINIVLLKNKKIFNNRFTSNEINSGMCSLNDTSGDIYIWRIEECIKVIIHECIHFLNFSDINDTQEIIDHYNDKYKTNNTSLVINESYTEIWARIINCFFASKLANIKDETINSYQYFVYLLEVEKKFSKNQSYKIIKYIKDKKRKGQKVNINKNTNVLSYHIITSEIINNLELFINFCYENNGEKNLVYLKNNNAFIKFAERLPIIQYRGNKIYFYKTFKMAATEIKII